MKIKLGVLIWIGLSLLIVMGFVGMLGILWIFSPAAQGTKRPKATEDLSTVAVYACQEFVTQRLKAPKTAEFPRLSEHKIKNISAGLFQIRSYVDSQNSFGALIRTSYTCQVKSHPGDKWELYSLNFDE